MSVYLEGMTENPDDSFSPEFRNITSRTARSGAMMLIAKCTRHGFAFLVYFLLLNLLVPSDFGLMKYITIVLGVINMLVELGFSIAIVQKPVLEKDEASSAFTITFLSGLVMYAGVYFGAPVISDWFHAPKLINLVRVGCLSLPLGGLSVVQRAIIQRKMQFKVIASIEVIAAVIGSTLSVVLAFLGFGVWSLVSSVLCFNAVYSLLYILYAGFPDGNYFRLSAAKSLCPVGFSMVFQRVIDYLTNNFDAILIGRYFGEFTLGIYGVAFDIVMLPRVALGAILSQVLISAFSRVQEEKERVKSGFLQLTVFISAVSVPFFMIVIALPKEILIILGAFRSDTVWLGAVEPLKILSLSGILYVLSSYPGMIWISLGKVKLRIFWAIAMAVTMVVAVLIGIKFGLSGVCWALLVRAAVLTPIAVAVSCKLFSARLGEYLNLLMPSFVSGTAMLIVIMIIEKLIPAGTLNSSVLLLCAGVSVGLSVYILIFVLFWREQFTQVIRPFNLIFNKPAN